MCIRDRDVLVQVEKGISAEELGQLLEDKGLVRDHNLFYLQLKLSAYSCLLYTSYVETDGDYDYDETVATLSRIFGIVGICPVELHEDEGLARIHS